MAYRDNLLPKDSLLLTIDHKNSESQKKGTKAFGFLPLISRYLVLSKTSIRHWVHTKRSLKSGPIQNVHEHFGPCQMVLDRTKYQGFLSWTKCLHGCFGQDKNMTKYPPCFSSFSLSLPSPSSQVYSASTLCKHPGRAVNGSILEAESRS